MVFISTTKYELVQKMECTQRLECTQELYETHTERVCPEQIGFLGICGAKHPILKGPNKIGRDPQTCSIILNLNSVSRQHAVINVLNSKEFMLMDLDSANKTKLLNKVLPPYIPHPMRNGDTVQFGDIFGIFRLLEDDDELPMTQAIDIPETPVPTQRYVSKLAKVHTTVIPESPDVSDRDDSLITTAQTNTNRTRLSSGQFVQSFGKTLPIQPISTPKTDTNSNFSKRSSSFNNANTSLNESYKCITDDKNIDNIHEMNTQLPYPLANPNINESTDSIYTADTQIPPSIHSLDTQIPTAENLPQVRKIDGQQEMQCDIYAANKENDLSIYNAETQPFFSDKDISIDNKSKSIETKEVEITHKPDIFLNKSNEELLFDEIDDGCLEDFNSQPLLPQESPIRDPTASSKLNNIESDNRTDQDNDGLPALKFTELRKNKNSEEIKEKVLGTASKRANRINSDDSTDCEDIDMLPTQKVEEINIKPTISKSHGTIQSASKRVNRFKSDSSTDCDDFESALTQKIPNLPEATDNSKARGNKNASVDASSRINMSHLDTSADSEDLALMATQRVLEIKSNEDEDVTDCEDDLIEPNSKKLSKDVKTPKFEDIPTQVLDLDPDHLKRSFEEMDTQIIGIDENAIGNSTNSDSFGDQPTQIIDEIIPNNDIIQKPLDTIISPFKIPLQSPIRVKSKDIPKMKSFIHPKDPKPKNISTIDDDNYYNATQDILDDLCTQRDESPIKTKQSEKSKARSSSPIIIDDELIPCSVEDYKVGQKFANIDRELDLSGSCEEHKAKNFAAGVSSQEVRNVISVEPQVEKPKNSDSSSDVDCTPKKKRPFVFSDSDLPDSQEIRNHISAKPNNSYTIESSSESESEINPEEQYTPIVHRTKKYKTVAKIDLTKRFEAQKLPERIITRVRKPTLKMEESVKSDKKITSNILKSKFLTEEEEYINEDILQENIKRLKTYARAKSSKENSNDTKTELNKNQTKCQDNKTELISKEEKNKNATEKKTNKSKEKIKVKIEKPKKKVAKDNKTKSKEDTSREEQESNTHKSKEKSPEPNSKIETDRNSQNDRTTSEIKSNFTSNDKINTRTTRSRRKGTDRKLAELKSASPENNKKATNSRSRRSTRKKEASNDSTTSEVEVRRSKRQVKAKENTSVTQDSETTQAPKSILKKSLHEQSTVYNVSSSSGESPKSLKRSLAEDIDVPSPKRTRAFVNSANSSVNNVSLKAVTTKNMKTQHVLFTAFPSDEVKHKLEELGAVVVTNVMECSIVLTMSIKRTFKLLCAVGLGRPVVGPAWVQACVDTQMIVNPWLYLIKDEAAEKRFQFDLEKTLKGKRNFLKGYNVSSTPNVQPNATEMKLIVECSGGVWKEGGSNWVCVSSSKDQSLWPSLRKRGATIVTTEFILGGVLKQKIEINATKFP